MADATLQRLRRAAQTDTHALARLYLERVRTGDLTEDRLKVAALAGNEAACLALDTHSLGLPPAYEAFYELLEKVALISTRLVELTYLSAARVYVKHLMPENEHAQEALSSYERRNIPNCHDAWINCPQEFRPGVPSNYDLYDKPVGPDESAAIHSLVKGNAILQEHGGPSLWPVVIDFLRTI